jgi:hypothetical protein
MFFDSCHPTMRRENTSGADLGQFEVGVSSSSSWAPHDDGASARFITTLPGLTMNAHTHNSKYAVDLG